MASTVEQLLVQVHASLVGTTAAGTRVTRGRADAFDRAELPALNVRRATTGVEAWADGLDLVTVVFDLDCEVRGEDWETTSDALHLAADTAMQSNAALNAMVRGFRCESTEATGEAGDDVAGRLTARYRAQFLQRRA
jgi:hypothetical protein